MKRVTYSASLAIRLSTHQRRVVEQIAEEEGASLDEVARELLDLGILIIILTITILLTWVAFMMFPTSPEAQKVITVFAGIFGVITGSIRLHKFFK